MVMPIAEPGVKTVGVIGIVVMGAFLAVLALALIYSLAAAWPLPAPAATTATAATPAAPAVAAVAGEGAIPAISNDTVRWFIFDFIPSSDQRLFLIVGLAGALGGTLHAMRSLYKYVGNRNLRKSWLLMYVDLPFVGALLGLAFYLVVRAGLISTQGAADAASPYGFAAVAVLVGLFSEQALTKLKQVGEAVFSEVPVGKDAIVPQVDAFEPARGAVGDTVKITGSGLKGATAVSFNGTPAVPTAIADDQIEVKVPGGATSGPISVTTPTGTDKSDASFDVQ